MVVKLEHVKLQREQKIILDNINWTIKNGQHWVLYGLNGAGKTALLNMLCAYHFPSYGNVEVCGHVFGKHILGEQLRRKVSIVSSAIQQKFNEEDNTFEIVLSGEFASIGIYEEITDDMRLRAKEILIKLGCMEFANRPYATLSQGEKQRALIGRALMGKPELLILDEPAAGFDFIAREQLLAMIQEISRQENAPTIIYVTHHVEEIMPIFKHLFLLKKGQVFAQGPTSKLLTSEVMSAFFDQQVHIQKYHNRYTIF